MEVDSLIIKILLEAVPGCQAIYRFGSWGTEAQRPDSDIDIAILPPEKMDSVQRWELAQVLAAKLGRDVDLVDLLSASTVMRMQVVAHGERIHAADFNAAEVFEDMVFFQLRQAQRGAPRDPQRRPTQGEHL